jgi:hypothetical protein
MFAMSAEMYTRMDSKTSDTFVCFIHNPRAANPTAPVETGVLVQETGSSHSCAPPSCRLILLETRDISQAAR